MTLYNNARHLREATESLLSQTESEFALVMLDDGSSVESEPIAREYEARDHLTAGRAIIAQLVEQYPAWAEWKRDLAWFDRQIAMLGP